MIKAFLKTNTYQIIMYSPYANTPHASCVLASSSTPFGLHQYSNSPQRQQPTASLLSFWINRNFE
jgi:hypothetical protein